MDSTGIIQEASGLKVPFDGSRRQGCLLADSVLGDLSGLRLVVDVRAGPRIYMHA